MNKLKLTDREWHNFRLGQIFDIENCKCSKVSGIPSGNTPYVGATNRNNGIISFIENKSELITKGNCIVFICDGEGSIGLSIYKLENFIGTTTVKVGRNPNLNRYTGMFISTISNRARGMYNFGYKRNEKNLKREILSLPIDSQGNPDWQFMENYIKQIEQEKIKQLIGYYQTKLLDNQLKNDRESRVESRESRVESRESRVESRESRVESRESRVESRESRVESRE
ncbi:restriction endonuclease subunit S [Moraxella sp. ZY210820]|uniref:restriction endonuclease subunit S n=1 Tax=Moraxella sp. ZY210820 TaxID=2904123 RepID=UPI002730B0F0|nr:restriction endonuclease subunit S [Moraxella sp. ZY210820]WLF84317.1 restriction endonuclease subunit S [Moraxella sp. ZY210820]